MSCIVYQTKKKTGEKYAYESISYWDKEKKQPRSKRKYIGKVDPVTGEIIKPRKFSAQLPHTDSADDRMAIEYLKKELTQKDTQIECLRNELKNLTVKYDKAIEIIKKITALLSAFE